MPASKATTERTHRAKPEQGRQGAGSEGREGGGLLPGRRARARGPPATTVWKGGGQGPVYLDVAQHLVGVQLPHRCRRRRSRRTASVAARFPLAAPSKPNTEAGFKPPGAHTHTIDYTFSSEPTHRGVALSTAHSFKSSQAHYSPPDFDGMSWKVWDSAYTHSPFSNYGQSE
jgi:hypothetical protein